MDESSLDPVAANLRWASLSRKQRAEIARQAQREEEVLQVMTVLGGNYRYEQVEAAINASGVAPMDLYMSLAANQHTIALARFYEALNGPNVSGDEGK
jgi:hypothetical protein